MLRRRTGHCGESMMTMFEQTESHLHPLLQSCCRSADCHIGHRGCRSMRGCELCLWLQDKLMTVVAEEGTSGGDNVHWIFKNKDHGKAAATASLGLVTLWDVEGGLPQLDKYLYSKDPHVVAGALLGVGIVNSNIRVSRSCHRSLTSAGGSSLKEGLAYRKPW